MTEHERELGELNAKVDYLAVAIAELREDTRAWRDEVRGALVTRLDLHSQRIQSLERWRAYLAGAIAMLGVLWALAQGLAGWKWK